MLATLLSVMVLGTIVLVLGAVALLRRGGSRRQAMLMLLVAAILAVNVAIWTLPAPGGSPAEQAAR